MFGGGGFSSGGFDPTRKPAGARAVVRDRLERGSKRGRMGRWERWLFTAIASVIALGVVVSVVLAIVG